MSKTKHWMMLGVMLLTLYAVRVAAASEAITFECDTYRYRIGSDGKNLSFTSRVNGKEILRSGVTGENAFSAWLEKDGKVFTPREVRYANGVLAYRFEGTQATASVKVTRSDNRISFEVLEVTGKPDTFVFVNIPLSLDAKPYEDTAACGLALNEYTHVRQLPALNNEFWAACYSRFQTQGAKVSLVLVEQKDILAAIRKTMTTDAPDIPPCKKGGAWALDSKDGYGSYLINHGQLTEKTVNQWIADCNKLGFNQIDNHGGQSNFFLFGSLEIDKKAFPEGWESFRKIVDQLHAAGIKSILHTYSAFVSMKSRYVSPVAHEDLYQSATFTLAKPLSKDATEVEVNEALTGPFKSASLQTIKIGGEIIHYTGKTSKAPWRFTGCKRGYHETTITTHNAGQKVGILGSCFNLYAAAPCSKLWDEIIQNHVDVVNQCGFDGIYFDAIEGYYHLWGKDYYWYYGGKFVMDIVRRLKKDVGMEYAGMIHSWWHYRSRYQAWDMPSRGYKRFLDVHIASMKAGEEYQHGSWLKDDALIDRYARMKDSCVYLPLQFGWWWHFPRWGRPNQDPTYSDDVEYICCKLLGNNAGFSCNADAYRPDWTAKLKQYEELRHAKYFDEAVLTQLREPRKEFELFRQTDGKWNFYPTFYRRHKVSDVGHETATWTVENEFDSQDLKLRIVPLYTISPYDSPDRSKLLCADDMKSVQKCTSASGVTFQVKASDKLVPATGEKCIEYTVENSGKVAPNAAWSWVQRPIPHITDNGSNRLGLGVWVHGDGLGEVLDFQIGSQSHYVTVDFSGWKYFELLETESTHTTKYQWPESMYVVYSHFTTFGNKIHLNPLRIWCNNVPVGKKTRCLIGPIYLLSYSDNQIRNPAVCVDGKKIVFPVTMKSGEYLELLENKSCKMYDPFGRFLRDIPVQTPVPTLAKGKNSIAFSCEPTKKTTSRVEVTVIGKGKPLQVKTP